MDKIKIGDIVTISNPSELTGYNWKGHSGKVLYKFDAERQLNILVYGIILTVYLNEIELAA